MRGLETDVIFLSWIRFHGRSQGLSDALGIRSYFIAADRRWPATIRYILQTASTLQLLVRVRPRSIVLMQPPVVALLPTMIYCWVFRARTVADLHSGTFSNPKWSWAAALTLKCLRSRHAAIVTNSALEAVCGGHDVKTFVLHDAIDPGIHLNVFRDGPSPDPEFEQYVLVPLAHSFDEPIKAILSAARTSAWTWILTGKASAETVRNAPSNVVFSGYVEHDEYMRLLSEAACVLALTTQENTMQRAGYESLMLGKALITSPAAVLKEYFSDAAIFSNSDDEDIADAVDRAMERREDLERRMIALRHRKLDEQLEALNELTAWLKT